MAKLVPLPTKTINTDKNEPVLSISEGHPPDHNSKDRLTRQFLELIGERFDWIVEQERFSETITRVSQQERFSETITRVSHIAYRREFAISLRIKGDVEVTGLGDTWQAADQATCVALARQFKYGIVLTNEGNSPFIVQDHRNLLPKDLSKSSQLARQPRD